MTSKRINRHCIEEMRKGPKSQSIGSLSLGDSVRSGLALTARRADVLKSSTIHGLPEVAKAKTRRYKLGWAAVFFISLTCCLLHLFFLLYTFLVSPNATSISYDFKSTLEYPTVHICPRTGRFLDPVKVYKAIRSSENDLTIETLYAIELGLGVINNHDYMTYVNVLDIGKLKMEYQRLVNNSGSILKAAEENYGEFSLPCDKVFLGSQCYLGTNRRLNCCQIFEKIFTMHGYCFATRPGVLKSSGVGILDSVRFNIWMERALIFKRERIFSFDITTTNFTEQAMKVVIEDGLDQTARFVDPIYMRKNEFIFFRLRQQRHIWLPNGDKCLSEDRAKLANFRNYTPNNCGWQKQFLDKMPLVNITCQLPMLALMKPGISLTNPCDLDEIMQIYDYRLLPTGRNTVPSMWQILKHFEETQNSVESSKTNECPFPCDFTRNLYSFSKSLADIDQLPRMIQIQLRFETHEMEVVRETPRQSVSEYISMVGGNIGLWTGASLISIGHLMVLLLKAIGCIDADVKKEADNEPSVKNILKMVRVRELKAEDVC